MKAGLAVHVAFDVQLAPEYLGSAEEDSCLGRRVNLADRLEHRVPVRSSEIGWRAQARDGVLVRIRVVDHDVGRVISLDLGREVLWEPSVSIDLLERVWVWTGASTYRVDLDVAVHILRFDGHEQRPEPFERSKVSAHPEEIHFPEPGLLLGVIHPIPDALEDRSKGGHSDARAHEHGHFVFENILRRAAKGSIHIDAGEDFANRRIHARASCSVIHTNNGRALRSLFLPTPLELASKCFAKRLGEITHAADVHGNVVLLGSTGQGEWMVLPNGYLWAAEKDVLRRYGD